MINGLKLLLKFVEGPKKAIDIPSEKSARLQTQTVALIVLFNSNIKERQDKTGEKEMNEPNGECYRKIEFLLTKPKVHSCLRQRRA